MTRLATFGPLAALGLIQTYPDDLLVSTMIVVLVGGWSVLYSGQLLLRRSHAAIALADAAVLGAVHYIWWSDPLYSGNVSAIRLAVTFACIGYQWHTDLLWGAGAALLTAVVTPAAALITEGSASVGHPAWWGLPAATLSRATWILICNRVDLVDQESSIAEDERQRQQRAAVDRRSDQELASMLHDVRQTLNAVGNGSVPTDAEWLQQRCHEDIDTLHLYRYCVSAGWRQLETVDLVPLLRDSIAVPGLPAEFSGPEALLVRTRVAASVNGAVREALQNVKRHANATRVTVRLSRGTRQRSRLEIVDDGVGFDADTVPCQRRGLHGSIYGRLARIGGAAVIDTSPGRGTRVVMTWE